MKIGNKVLAIVVFTIVGLILIMSMTSVLVMMSCFYSLEEHQTEQGLNQTMGVMNREIASLARIAGECVFRDDTLDFIDAPDDYDTGNHFNDTTFSSAEINMVMIYNSSGKLVYGKGYNLTGQKEEPLPEDLLRKITPGSLLLNTSGPACSGIILTNATPMYIVSCPIVKSNGSGTVRGTLIMGRYLDSPEIKRISDTTHLPLSIDLIDSPALSPAISAALLNSDTGNSIVIQANSFQAMTGYAVMDDIDGRPAVVLKIDSPMNILKDGMISMVAYILVITAILVIFSILIMYLIDVLVLRRMNEITQGVRSISTSNDLLRQIRVDGDDELALLTTDINHMLVSIGKYETDLKDSEARFRALFSSMLNAFACMRVIKEKGDRPLDLVFFEVNPMFEEATGLRKEQLEGKSVNEVLPELFQYIYNDIVVLCGSDSSKNDVRGEGFFPRMNKWYMYTVYRSVEGYVAILFYEITTRKQAEDEMKNVNELLERRVEARTAALELTNRALRDEIAEHLLGESRLKASLAEKDVMLKEIHHRVKNNLQIISSLLSLQQSSLASPADVEAFKEFQDRIRSMALVHEQLYQSQDLASVSLDDYARSLTSYLFGKYSVDRDSIKLRIEIEKAGWGLDTAIVVGLLLNELVSNSIKHAFTDGMTGEIAIRLNRAADGCHLLEVSDDGIGLPADINPQDVSTLGLRLVCILANQLEATMEIGRDKGTVFSFFFKNSGRQ